MKRGMLIVIEGTDCSGKETQSNKLVEFLNKNGYKTNKYAFPNYDSPTGKIIAGPYLGKEGYSKALFPEGASNVDPYCASLLYAMDRKYNIAIIEKDLASGINVVLDRYVESNMAHQGCKLEEKEKEHMFYFLETLEYDLLKLPRADLLVLLHMPTWASIKLKSGRLEPGDQHENDKNHLQKAEQTYLSVARRNNAEVIECTKGEDILSIEEINKMLCEAVVNKIKEFNK